MKEQTFVAREFEIFGGLDVDKKSIAVTFMSQGAPVTSLLVRYWDSLRRPLRTGRCSTQEAASKPASTTVAVPC